MKRTCPTNTVIKQYEIGEQIYPWIKVWSPKTNAHINENLVFDTGGLSDHEIGKLDLYLKKKV